MIDRKVHEELRQQYNPEGSALRQLQEGLLDILVKFDAFCREKGLSYSVSYGTMLGAIRHHGFIPWDDDVDTMMTRAEWEEFKKHIREDGHITDEIEIREMVHPQVCIEGQGWIDILILDYVPKNRLLNLLKGVICVLLCLLIKCKNRIILHHYKRVKPWFVLIPVAYCIPLKTMQQWKDKVAQWFTPKEIQPENGMRFYASEPDALRLFHPYKELIGDRIEVEFEGHRLLSTPNYDALLRIWYGDYMQLPKRPTNLGRVTGADLCDIR